MKGSASRRGPALGLCVALVAACAPEPADPGEALAAESFRSRDAGRDAGRDARRDGTADARALDASAGNRCGAGSDVELDAPAIDGRLAGARLAARIRLREDGAWSGRHPLRVAVVRAGAEVALLAAHDDAVPGSTLAVSWDGAESARPAAPGPYALRVTYGCAGAPPRAPGETPFAVVRVGVVRVSVGSGDGLRIPLLWHRLGDLQRNYWLPALARPVLVRGRGAGAVDLERTPAVWTGLASPPVSAGGDPVATDYDLPFALRVGTRPDLTLIFGLAGDARIRARVEGATAASEATITDGSTGTFRLAVSPAPALGRYDLALRVRYELQRPDGAWRTLGTEAIPLRVYGLLGPQTIAPVRHAPFAAWVAVVDAVAQWVGGRSADPAAVAARIVRGVNEELGLRYDAAEGASAYTQYAWGFGDAHFDLTGFLARENGSTVNCSDCASLVATYANMVGCDLGYNILTEDFRLHALRAIGARDFTTDPFDRGQGPGRFAYHAVTSPLRAGRVFDATLRLDGDADPARAPFLDTPVEGLDWSFYLSHLSPDRLDVAHADKTTLE